MKPFFILVFTALIWTCSFSQPPDRTIDLSGEWQFRADPGDRGISEKWFAQSLEETVTLPGSMAENGKGEDIKVDTEWTGQIVDQSWFTDERYAPYRKEDNIKVPFWLQPEKHFIGAAWYRKVIDIPFDWGSKRITLFLERPHWETQVWVNGEHLGMQNRLGTPHVFDLTAVLNTGENVLTIRVDNRVKEVNPGVNSHSISDHTQSNWNGIAGKIELQSSDLVFLSNIQVFPDVIRKQVVVKGLLNNLTGGAVNPLLTVEVSPFNGQAEHESFTEWGAIEFEDTVSFAWTVSMGDDPWLWDEFNPNLYKADITLESELGFDRKEVTFGMREFKAKDTQFAVNGGPIFLRGTLECAIFPKTGYPATDLEEWTRIFRVIKSHGLNHMRFHSWCPPEAAFEAADREGIYLQVECSSWANQGSSLGDGGPIDTWIYREAEAIVNAYGNHPSFCMMAYGNEPAGKNQVAFLADFMDHLRSKDDRRVYTSGAGWPYVENADYFSDPKGRIQGWGQELNSIINKEPPQTMFDYRDQVENTPMPYISHEIGQWCVYPNFNEIKKYTGVLKPKNFEIFRETLEHNHMGHLADSFLIASGKLQALCYKADIEAALRTKGFGGFQLLDLHDFPGQGTALVGVLDPFWEEKGYITPEEYSRFCNRTVPLARMPKRIYLNDETIEAKIEVAHFGNTPLKAVIPTWSIRAKDGSELAAGDLEQIDIPLGNGTELGLVQFDPGNITKPGKITLTVDVNDFTNSWDLWVYPEEKEKLPGKNSILITSMLDEKAIKALDKGKTVLLTSLKGSVRDDMGGSVKVGFSSIFWNTAWTSGQGPHTLGILCDPGHPALAEFPTEFHSGWQWWDAMSHANALVLDGFDPELKPVVRVIDDWFANRRLALVFEAKVGKGKILVSGIDLLTDQDNRPEARQLLYSLQKYMLSDQFNPSYSMTVEEVASFYK